MGINYKENNQWEKVKVKVGDNIPVGAEMDYDGSTIPVGWEEITNPNVYSTSEVKTDSVWINGKPIYRKVVEATSPNPSATPFDEICYNTSSLNIDKLIKLEGAIYSGENTIPIPFQYIIGNNSQHISLYYNSSNGIHFWADNAIFKNQELLLFIEYTKTTD